jgi:glycosyltransferase involved in cell wall biosynthesis
MENQARVAGLAPVPEKGTGWRGRRRNVKMLVIADPHVPVPPVNYGGSERIIDLMCRGLVRRGHQVHLVAGPGSRNYGGGLTIHRAPSSTVASRVARKLWFQLVVSRAALGSDIIINHARIDYLEVIYWTDKPVIHWFHVPLNGREVPYVLSRRQRGDHFVGVSHAQVARSPGRFQVIHNALDVRSVPFVPDPGPHPYLLFLGQLTRQKGVHLAIEAARRAGIKRVIGGKVPAGPDAAEFFAAAVKPCLGPECEWVGLYDEATRVQLVAGAAGLLFPIQAEEAFGLVMIEALAGGVPVIAMRMASTPEVVIDGVNGFLCESVDQMVAAIHRVKEISRHECRASVEDRFGEPQFIRRVEAVVAKALTS